MAMQVSKSIIWPKKNIFLLTFYLASSSWGIFPYEKRHR